MTFPQSNGQIRLEETAHKYILTGYEYIEFTSVTTCISEFFDKFFWRGTTAGGGKWRPLLGLAPLQQRTPFRVFKINENLGVKAANLIHWIMKQNHDL